MNIKECRTAAPRVNELASAARAQRANYPQTTFPPASCKVTVAALEEDR